MKHILVTGGAGFIGSHLVERLLNDGERVVVIDDCSTGDPSHLKSVATQPGLRTIWSKVSKCPELDRLVSGAKEIYHLAAAVGVELVIRSPVETIQTNLHETEAILEVAANHQIPILLASTSEVYGRSVKPAFEETDDLQIGPPQVLRWSYACSKLLDEFLAMAYARDRQLPVIIARLFNTVGPRQTGRYGMVLPRFIAAAREGKPLLVHGDGSQTRCFCYVLDTVEALIRLQGCPSARNEIFNVGTDQEISIGELARTVIDILGSSSQIQFIPYHEAYPAPFEDMMRRRPVIQKLERAAGFRPMTALREMITATAGVSPREGE